MKPVVENFEIRKAKFSRWLFGVLFLMSLLAFFIAGEQGDNRQWIAVVGWVLFGGGFFISFKQKITVRQDGFEREGFRKARFVLWDEITALHYNMVYHGHGAQGELKITTAEKTFVVHPEQYRRKPMQRFFEVLNEQCTGAVKNVHFLNKAEGKMNWRNKLKMF